MPEFLTNFSNQITEYWGRFTRRQQIQIIILFAVGLVALVALTLVLSRPTYVVYDREISQSDMNTIIATLDEARINYRVADNGTTLEVDSGRFQDVSLQLADLGFLSSADFSNADAFNNSLGTTSDERDLKFQLRFESEMNEKLELFDIVEDAKVKFVIPDEKVFVFEEQKQASASVILTLNGDMTDEQAYSIASYIQRVVSNLSLDNITIMDARTSKMLYNGPEGGTAISGLNAYMEIENIYQNQYDRNLELLLLSSTGYDAATVYTNLEFDFDEVSIEAETTSSPTDADSPYPTRVYIYESTGTSTDASGVPGTDSNDATTYMVDSGGSSDSNTTINETDYAIDVTRTFSKKAVGDIRHDQSSVTVVLNKYVYYYEEALEAEGLLADTTWTQYKRDNDEINTLDVDQNMVDFIANASRIEDVNVMITEVPVFEDAPIPVNRVADYIPVAIIVLMIAMLGYAVYRGTEPVEITEIEPELSVEEMLATTSRVSDELDAIDMSGKSEARVQIEKFVEENPEAVAQLLRNWLNEDWE